MSFDLTTLSEYATVEGGFAYKSQDFIDEPSIAVLKIKNIRQGFIDYSSSSYVSGKTAQTTAKWFTSPRDILISMTGSGPSAPDSLVGRVARVWAHEPRALINQRIGRLKLKNKDVIDSDFLYYLLSQKEVQDFLVTNSTGSANQVNISSKTIEAVPCPRITYIESQEVATFLNAFEQRIRLLRETNTTLEAIAQALFKSWFVDFDPVHAKMQGRVPEGMDEATAALFPDGFEESELGLVPRGWKTTQLNTFCTFQKGCSYKGSGLAEAAGAYMFNLGCFNAPRIFAMEKIKRYTGEYKERHAVTQGDLILGNTDVTQARDILGRPLLIPAGISPGFISHHVFKVDFQEGKKELFRNYLFFTFGLPSFRERAIGYATGTTVLSLPKEVLSQHEIVTPSIATLKSFNSICSPIFERIELNLQVAKSLATLRDTLLPSLVSGKLRIE